MKLKFFKKKPVFSETKNNVQLEEVNSNGNRIKYRIGEVVPFQKQDNYQGYYEIRGMVHPKFGSKDKKSYSLKLHSIKKIKKW